MGVGEVNKKKKKKKDNKANARDGPMRENS